MSTRATINRKKNEVISSLVFYWLITKIDSNTIFKVISNILSSWYNFFFVITIVPEKELVMILRPKDKRDRIMESIKAEFSDAEPGSGIAFRTAVESFDMLGTRRSWPPFARASSSPPVFFTGGDFL